MATHDLAAVIRLDDGQAAALVSLFGVTPAEGQSDVEAVAPYVEGIARAGFEEYVLAMTGVRIPAGVRDLRELRLRLLSEHLPGGLPSDRLVASLFRLTLSQARTLIAGTRARFPDEFAEHLQKAARRALENADRGDDDDTVRITASDSLASYLRDLLTESQAPQPLKRTDASHRYDLSRETVAALCPRLGMNPADVRHLG